MGKKLSDFWIQTASSTLGTVIGIVITFGTTAYLQYQDQKEAERTAALMVIHNLDRFCGRLAEDIRDIEAEDSLNIAVWQHYPDSLDEISSDTLKLFIRQLLSRHISVSDNTAENIFSSNIDTWKNIGSSEFIENAGKCFSAKRFLMKLQEDLYEEKQTVYDIYNRAIVFNAPANQGLTEHVAQVFRSADICCFIQEQHEYYLGFLRTGLAALREQNDKNKRLMGVTDDELQEFGTKDKGKTYNSSDI